MEDKEHYSKISKDNYNKQKEDIKSRHKKYYYNNKEKIKERIHTKYYKNIKVSRKQNNDYYFKNKEKLAAGEKKRYWKERELRCERTRSYYQKNKIKRCTQIKEYNKNNPEIQQRSSMKRYKKESEAYGIALNAYRYAIMAWKAVIMKQDNEVCVYCGAKGKKSQLEAHHIIYKKTNMGMVLITNNGCILCKKCHKELHRLNPIKYGKRLN